MAMPSSSRTSKKRQCQVCNRAIRSKYVMQLRPDLYLHAKCLTCCRCGRTLTEQQKCYMKEGCLYCEGDYFKEIQCQCSMCQLPFLPSDPVVQLGPTTVMHSRCFNCSVCRKPIEAGFSMLVRPDGTILCRDDALLMDAEDQYYEMKHNSLNCDGFTADISFPSDRSSSRNSITSQQDSYPIVNSASFIGSQSANQANQFIAENAHYEMKNGSLNCDLLAIDSSYVADRSSSRNSIISQQNSYPTVTSSSFFGGESVDQTNAQIADNICLINQASDSNQVQSLSGTNIVNDSIDTINNCTSIENDNDLVNFLVAFTDDSQNQLYRLNLNSNINSGINDPKASDASLEEPLVDGSTSLFDQSLGYESRVSSADGSLPFEPLEFNLDFLDDTSPDFMNSPECNSNDTANNIDTTYNNTNNDEKTNDDDNTKISNMTSNGKVKPLRSRTYIADWQQERLISFYKTQSKPTVEVRNQVADEIGLDAKVVKNWFQNKRCSEKRTVNSLLKNAGKSV